MRRFTTLITSSVLVLSSTAWLAETKAQAVRGREDGASATGRAPRAAAGRSAAPARAEVQDEPAADKPFDAEMERLLKLWEGQSRNLKSLDVMIYRKDVDGRAVLGGEQHYQGTAKFESPNRAYIEFNLIKLDKNKKPVIDPKTRRRVTEPYEQIKCTGSEVWQYVFDSKQIFVYPLNKEDQARALDEGPLPFLFNMKADEARNRYHMTLLKDPDPKVEAAKKVYQIKVVPKLAIDKEDFGEAIVELERRFLLPTRIVLFSPDRTGTREYYLSGHKANPVKPIDPIYFQGVEYKAPWKVVRNPKAEAALRDNAGAPAAKSRTSGPTTRRR